MRLFLDIGQYDWSAKRTLRPGSAIAAVAENAPEGGQGVMLVCAEGVAGRPDTEQAARSVTSTLDDVYYSAADASSPHHTLEEGLNAANQSVRASGESSRAATVAALVLQGRHWYVGNAGQIRAWRYRDLQIKQLTRDHVIPLSPGRTEVTKACGLGPTLEADYTEGTLKEGDVFAITSPGVHDVLAGSELLSVLQGEGTAQQMAETLVQRALTKHSPGYAAACIARVEKLPRDAGHLRGSALGVIELPEPGAEVDGFAIEKLIIKSRRFRLYKATDKQSGQTVALRFPDPSYPESAQTFLREESIGRRIDSPYVMKPIAVQPGRRSALYSVVEYHSTESLAKRIRRKEGLSVRETLRLADQLLVTLETLHQQGIMHGDIRPHNLLYDKRKRKIYVFGLMATRRGNHRLPSGALSYRAPELFQDSHPTERSDIYAAGVTIYRILTGAYPYGKLRPDVDWKKLRYEPITRYREKAPPALDDVLARACSLEPNDRYATVGQLVAALAGVQIDNTKIHLPTPPSDGGSHSKWAWATAAALVVALFAYLYVALR